MNRLDPQALRNRLHAAGTGSKKSLGQHFLVDATVLQAALDAAQLEIGESVVEIGPGPGVLTEALLNAGMKVAAYEADPAMVRLLKEDFPSLTVYEGDAIALLPSHVASPYKVVANIPYQITTPLLRLLLEGDMPRPVSATLLIQREVADRLAAKPRTGERGYLSVLTQYFATVSIVTHVPPRAFWPEPAVDSAVIHLEVKQERPLPEGDERAFFAYVKARFVEPRKQLKNVLAGMRGVPTASLEQELKDLGFASTIRAQELTEADWITLFTHHV